MRSLSHRSARGFTLIELMIVVAIIGILAAIAIPKFADLVTRSKESSVKGSLGSVRSAVSVYYSDNEGVFPTNLGTGLTTGGKYLDAVPTVSLPPVTAQSNPGHTSVSSVAAGAGSDGTLGGGSSVWFYTNSGSAQGAVTVNCSHLDTKGTLWTAY